MSAPRPAPRPVSPGDSAEVDEFVAAGYRPSAAAAKVRLLGGVRRALPGSGTQYVVPGRIEVFGKHTDYCGGRSLVCATEQGLVVAARDLDPPVLRVHALDLGGTVDLPLDADADDGRDPPWSRYPRAVARRIALNFGPGSGGSALRGVELAVAGDLPQAAGLSSSSALVVACFVALSERNGLADHPLYRRHLATPEALSHYLGCVENGSAFGALAGEAGVGTSGGSQDHAAILGARPGHLSQFAFCPVRRLSDVALPADLVFVVAVSGVVAEKAGAARAAYNATGDRARAVLARWNEVGGAACATLAEAVDATPTSLWEATDPALRPRLDQFLRESGTHVPGAADALRAGDLRALGDLAARSQALAETGLENQVPETIHLAASATRLGAAAASAFGAGFGGSVWALARTDDADALARRWADDYAGAFPNRAGAFFTTRPAPPAHAVRR